MIRVGIALALLAMLIGPLNTHIEVLNPQSYPLIGDEWVVHLNVSGKSDLLVNSNWEGFTFKELRCGINTVLPIWDENSLTFQDFSCDKEAEFISVVDKEGKHVIDFKFGDSSSQARNFAKGGYVQDGVTTFSSAVTRMIQKINPVNTSASFIILHIDSPAETSPDDLAITPEFLNDSYLAFDRFGSETSVVNVWWQVIESQDLWVQRGEVNLATSTYEYNTSINPVNLSNTFVITYGSCSDNTNADNRGRFYSGQLFNDSWLWLKRYNAGNLCASNVSYQVISWDGVIVQSGVTYIPDNEYIATDTLNSPVNLSRTMLFTTFSADTGTDAGMDSNLIKGRFANDSAVYFDTDPSVYANSRREVAWYSVEYPRSRVQSDYQDLTTIGYFNETLESVQVNRSFHFTSWWGTGGGTSWDNGLQYGDIASPTNYVLYKSTTGQDLNVSWFVMEIPPRSDPPIINNVTVNVSTIEIYDAVLIQANITNEYGYNTSSVNVTLVYPNSTEVNLTLTEGTYPFWEYNFTDTGEIGYYNVTNVWAQDDMYRVNRSFLNTIFYARNSAPKWYNVSTDIVLTYSPTQNSYFNITWVDQVTYPHTVYFESNISGTSTNYTMYNTSNVYWFNTSIAAGTWYWTSWANDTYDEFNKSDTTIFTIDKAPMQVDLLIDGYDANYEQFYYQTINFSAFLGLSELLDLYIADSKVDSGIAPIEYLNSYSTKGVYNVTAFYDGQENYSNSFETHYLTIIGKSKIDWLSPLFEKGTPGDLVDLYCNVSDQTTHNVINNYPVKFWVDDVEIADVDTNSSGIATTTWDTTGYSTGVRNLKCNITRNGTLFYNVTTFEDTNSFTLVEMNKPTLSVISTDLIIGKNNSNDNATVRCNVGCSGGNCEGLQVGLQRDIGGTWDWIVNTEMLINGSNPEVCGTASSCENTWDIQGLFNDSFPIRCNASATYPLDTQINSGSNSIDIVVGQLSIESWTPSTTPLDLSIYDTFTIDPIINCTSPPNAKAGCGEVTMFARTNQTTYNATDAITVSTDINLDAGTVYQVYSANFPSVDGGSYEVPFNGILANMSVGGNNEIRSYDVKVNSSDPNVTEIDPVDRSVLGHTGQITVSIYNTTTSNDKSFELKYNISCQTYRCLDIRVWPRYNSTTPTVDTLAPTTISPSAYNVSQQPYVNLDMGAGEEKNNQIMDAWSSTSVGFWATDIYVNTSYLETSFVNSVDGTLEITLIKLDSELISVTPKGILEEESSNVSGYCNCTGGTCSNTVIGIGYYDGNTWINTIPTDDSGPLKINVSSYAIGSLSGVSQNYTFNVTGKLGGTYLLRAQCSSDEDSSGSTNTTLEVNDYPDFNNSQINTSIFYYNQEAKFSIDIQDEAGIAWTNFTIEGVNYSAVSGSGDEWYYNWNCSVSNPSINWTAVFTNDTEGYYNSTTVSHSAECDAQNPDVTSPSINDTSIVNIGTYVQVSATITDPESNLDAVLLEVNRPTSSDYNITPDNVGSSYFYNFTLFEVGLWRFTFYANDTGNQMNGTLALDGNQNQFINVMDIENPVASGVEINETLTKGIVKLNASVTDNVEVDYTLFTVDGVNYTQTGNNGNDWYYNWVCSGANQHTLTRVWANDTTNNWDSSSVSIAFTCDTLAPSYTDIGQNTSTPGEEEIVKLYAYWDNVYADLGTAILQTNETGIWQDLQYHKFSSKPEWSNFSYDTTNKPSTTIYWRILANNSLGTLNNTMPIQNFYIRDVKAPTFVCQGSCEEVDAAEGVVLNLNTLWSDDVEVDWVIFGYNKTSSPLFQNQTLIKATSTPFNDQVTYNTSGDAGETICFYKWSNDTSGNWNYTWPYEQICIYVNDLTPPTFNLTSDNSTSSLEAPEQVFVSTYWYDNLDLSYASLKTNKSGSFADEKTYAFSTNPEFSNMTIDTKGYGNKYVCWTIYANDSAGNLNNSMSQSQNCFYINDTVYPKWSLNYTTTPVAGIQVEHGVNWYDDGGLSGFIFSYDNCTGSFVNDSWQSLTGTDEWSVVSKGLNQTIGCQVNWKIYLNDSRDQWNETSTFSYLTLENKAPKWYDNSTNITLAGWPVSHNLRWEDDGNVSGHIFSWYNGVNWTKLTILTNSSENGTLEEGRGHFAQTYVTNYGQDIQSGVVVNFDSTTDVQNRYRFNSSDVIIIEESGWHKITYGCNFEQTSGNNRAILDTWVEKNGDTEIVPSRTHCYIRETGAADMCSNQATFLANLSQDEYIRLKAITNHGVSGFENITDSCWLTIQNEIYPSVQMYDTNGGDLFSDTTEITVSIDTLTKDDNTTFLSNTTNHSISVKGDGWYKMYYHVCSINDPQTNRNTPRTYLRINDTALIPSYTHSYLRNTGDGDMNCETGYQIYNLSAGDRVQMRHLKISTESAGTNSATLADKSWLVMEKLKHNQVLMVYSDTAQTFASLGAVQFQNSYFVGPGFNHTAGTTPVFVNKTGLYEVSYTLGWDDESTVNQGSPRRRVCAYLRLNGTKKVNPSQLCDQTRYDNNARWQTVSGNVVMNLSNGDYLELMVNPSSSVNLEPNSTWITLVYLNDNETLDYDTNYSYRYHSGNVPGTTYELVKSLNITLQILDYGNNGSTLRGNKNPDIFLEIYNGTEYVPWEFFGINGTGNFTINITDHDMLIAQSNWQNRLIRLLGTNFDYVNGTNYDRILYHSGWAFFDSTQEFLNDTWTENLGLNVWSNTTKEINGTVGSDIRWRVWANDSLNNWNVSDTFTYQTQSDDKAPKWYSNMTNDTTLGQPILHSVYWVDNAIVDGYIFSYDNCTGTFVNESWIQTGGSSTWVNITKVSNFTHNCQVRWQVWANDSWGNLWNVTPQLSYFTTYTANLKSGKISFNNTSPTEGEAVLISVNVTNLGPTIANNSVVFFNSTDSNGVFYSYGLVKVNLSVGYQTVSKVANFTQGTHIINVSVWPDSIVNDKDYSNNWNDTNVSIPIWSYFYGNVSGTLGLAAPNETYNLYLWNPQNLSGNVFIVDYDSGVDFFDMWPLNGTNDFNELDLALGTENYTDSIAKTYDKNNDDIADNTTSITVYGTLLNNVPVVNATNGSPWLVGLIWDRSDGGVEYDGTQDVAFVTELNIGTLGAFGVSDYELKAPSSLKSLRGSVELIATRMEVR